MPAVKGIVMRPSSRGHGASVAALCAVLILTASAAVAQIRLPKVFGSHMVLQRERPIVVWGWAKPNETVTVRIGPNEGRVKATADGTWRATLPAMPAGGPHTLTVTGSSSVRMEDVLIGDVWLCSGQSNMEQGIAACDNADREIPAASHPNMRLLMVPNRFTPVPQDDIDAAWKVCTPASVAEGGWGGFSGAAYYFGRELQRQLNVPIGLIDATWGGTVIQTWTPPDGYAVVPELKDEYRRVLLGSPSTDEHVAGMSRFLGEVRKWIAATDDALKQRKLGPAMPAMPAELLPPSDVQHATALYNGMIHPLVPLGIRGAIWYQGESNRNEGRLYTERMKALIGGWRKVFANPDLPFYYVQIAPFNYGGNPSVTPEFWEAQTAAEAIPNTGMAVINDIGNLADIHPKNKHDVGKRLALLALAGTYGRQVVARGPTFKSMKIEGDRLRVTFENVGTGLMSRNGKPLDWFEIIDADQGGFVKAQAEIDGASVVLSAAGVNKPVAVRFAWHMLAEPNLCNKEGLPANSFRAGDVPKRDLLTLHVPEHRDLRLVYDLDLGKLVPQVRYDVDKHAEIRGAFDRIAYMLELTLASGETQFAYVSMDAFTDDASKIGLPVLSSGAFFRQNVTNLNVISNVTGIVPGTGLKGGNIEFWPSNYGPTNSGSVPNASGEIWDFGDEPGDPRDGYGCMQVHNHEARQTIFAINNWKAAGSADIGIGNRTTDNPDWTFAANASSYIAKRLRVFVRMK